MDAEFETAKADIRKTAQNTANVYNRSVSRKGHIRTIVAIVLSSPKIVSQATRQVRQELKTN